MRNVVAKLQKLALSVAKKDPVLAYELDDMAEMLHTSEGELPPEFLENMKKKDDSEDKSE